MRPHTHLKYPMRLRMKLVRHLAHTLGLLLLATTALGLTDRKFTASPTISAEVSTMVKMLEQWHYNREAVRSTDYAQVIPDYMESLDGQKLFFLHSDKTDFETRFNKTLYWNISAIGKIDAAYDIFSIYEKRTTDRINWIFAELDGKFDFTTNEVYRVDRSKSEWAANPGAADELWRQRLKYELIAEMLNKKTEEEAKQTVRKRYERMLKNLADIEASDLAELFLSTVARLYDPHSTYFSAETYEDFGIQMKLELVGIGALLGIEEDLCSVKEIVPGGPADLGKQLKPNDKIISVKQENGEPVEIIGMKLRKIVDLIRGPKHSKVTLLVQPAEATDPSSRREVVIIRDVVKLNSARAHGAIFQVPGANGETVPMGVITLPSFYGPAGKEAPDAEKTSATQDVAKLITQLTQAGAKGLVLDLRRNGGGYLTEATQLTGLFIKQGPVVQVKSSSGEIAVDSDDDSQIAYDGPLAVLVDRFSASASEIVAGALQNYGRAIVIGDSSTHGKGSVQTVLEMKDFLPQLMRTPAKTGATKITVQKYYLPSGASTQLKGVVPDIVLPSLEDHLPIGESDLPHALVWDEIPNSFFDGNPLDPQLVESLRQRSVERQGKLEEFTYLQKSVDWFRSRQEQKLIPLNLEARKAQREVDAAFRKEMKEMKLKLAKDDYPYTEFHLVPPPPKPIKAPPAADADTGDAEPDELSTDEDDGSYAKVDVNLRESFRVIYDAIKLGQNGSTLASNRLPLTARLVNKS